MLQEQAEVDRLIESGLAGNPAIIRKLSALEDSLNRMNFAKANQGSAGSQPEADMKKWLALIGEIGPETVSFMRYPTEGDASMPLTTRKYKRFHDHLARARKPEPDTSSVLAQIASDLSSIKRELRRASK